MLVPALPTNWTLRVSGLTCGASGARRAATAFLPRMIRPVIVVAQIAEGWAWPEVSDCRGRPGQFGEAIQIGSMDAPPSVNRHDMSW